MELLVATRNAGKLREIRSLLDGVGITVLGLEAFPELPEVDEDGDTFAANALKKARVMCELTGRVTLADDSGLEVDALGGKPGVLSARYAGPGADDAANNHKLLAAMKGVPEEKRSAAFRCAMVLVTPAGEVHEVSGSVQGVILDEPSGTGGFGYDPLFWLPEHEKTMAEIPIEEKNLISHRGKALSRILPVVKNLLG